MERLPDRHLNLYELTLLVSDRTFTETQLEVSDSDRRELEDHLLLCGKCRELLEQEQLLFLLSMRSRGKDNSHVVSNCPSEQTWMEIVAGQYSPGETQRQLEHALGCIHCAALLKRAAEQFADETTDEERHTLKSLASTDPDWQTRLARQMQTASLSNQASPYQKKTWHSPRFPNRLAFAIASAVLLLGVAWWFTLGRPDHKVNRLLSEAYSAQRTTALRMSGARYAPVLAFRGNEAGEVRRPTSLLQAEILIAKELSSRPDDPFWLDAQGRADLMNDHYASALSSLDRAHQYAPADQKIRIDLANAYFLRGEELKRSEDYGRAADLLGQVLSKDPGNEIARFNRAVVSERLRLYEQAIEDWRQYLKLDSVSSWSEEARKHLKDLEDQTKLHKQKAAKPLADPAKFLTLADDGLESSHQELNDRTERYLEVALGKWAPEAFLSAQTHDSGVALGALEALAKILASNHGDLWLTDFLSERNPAARAHLVDAFRPIQSADFDDARKSAVEAASAFRASRMPAGELMAEFESSYADQLAHQVTNCLAETQSRAGPQLNRYPWLHAQLDLEAAACLDWNDENAPRLAAEALSLAKSHHYPSLELRATTFLAGLSEDSGDTSSAWRYSSEGLAQYWEGDYLSVRGYSLYEGLDSAAEDAEEWSLDVQVLEETAEFVRGDRDFELRAMHQYRLANALVMTGDYAGAERSLHDAQSLLLVSTESTRKTNLEFEAQIGLAKLDLLRSRPETAIGRLEPWKTTARQFSDRNLAFDYFRNLGLAYFATGESDLARHNLTSAVTAAERSLQMNHDERERFIWSRKSDEVYRAMVQLGLERSPEDAFAEWEWFKGASLRGSVSRSLLRPSDRDLSNSTRMRPSSALVPANTAVVSFALLPEGTFAWIFSRDGVRQYQLGRSNSNLERLVYKFADHCSHPDSNLEALQAESHELYRKLLAPMEPWLRPYENLVIEPDQNLWMIPFEALLDQNGVYLGDRYAVSFSPGLDYLLLSPSEQGISEQSRIVIAGDPESSGRVPLDDAEEEAKGIAHRFRYNTLLLKRDAGYGRIADNLEDADIFHFSGHATASPDGVGLLLGDSVMDISKIRVSRFKRLKLAVLSACNTANGATAEFNDRDSVARLLVGAGVPDVVASRWMVSSRATASLMKEFYTQLLSGKGVSSALREASRKLRGNQEFVHPFYWANFSVFGKS